MERRRFELDTRELMLLDAGTRDRARNQAAAWILWFLLGGLGAHRFYMGSPVYGAVMLVVNLVLTVLTVLTSGLWLPAAAVWWLVEAFLLPGLIRADRERAERETMELLRRRG
ncbi:MAG: TM2 domain-containing protein [Chloroflexi bacterium]|nr:TM2 domain-containing protein [Chloroflexota bacterium]